MSSLRYATTNTPACRMTVFSPAGNSIGDKRILCFDTGPLAPELRMVPRGNDVAPPRDAFPAAYAASIVHAAHRGYLRVLDRHAKNSLDVEVRIIGSVYSIVEQFAGPTPAVEVLARVYVYVAMRDEYYDAALAAGAFSFAHIPNDNALTPEISPTPIPYFTGTRVFASNPDDATFGDAQFFSENAVRDPAPQQFSKQEMSEGTPQTTSAAPASAAPTATAAAVASMMTFAAPLVSQTSYQDLVAANKQLTDRVAALTQEFDAARKEHEDTATQVITMRAFAAALYSQRVPTNVLCPADLEKFSAALSELTNPVAIPSARTVQLFSTLQDVERMSLYALQGVANLAKQQQQQQQTYSAAAGAVAAKRTAMSEPVPVVPTRAVAGVDGGVGLFCDA